MDEQLIKHIEELGLSNKESRVYLANLMLGPAGVQQIADTSGIKRVTTYVILESLVSLGLVSQITKAKKTLFNAEAPENLNRLLEKREQSLKDQKQHLKGLLPDLNALKLDPKVLPDVKFYEGVEGIKTVFKTFINESKATGVEELLGMSNVDELYAFFPEIAAAKSNPDRVKAGVHSRMLYTSSQGGIYKLVDESKNREARIINQDIFPIKGDISILGSRIAMVSLAPPKPVAFVITNAELATTLASVFELAWTTASAQNSNQTGIE